MKLLIREINLKLKKMNYYSQELPKLQRLEAYMACTDL